MPEGVQEPEAPRGCPRCPRLVEYRATNTRMEPKWFNDPVPSFGSFPTEATEGSVPAEPACGATDATSGVASCTLTGYSTAVGTHTLTQVAVDEAGNRATASLTYVVRAKTPPAAPVVTRVSRRSMKSRIGGPKRRSRKASRKNRAPRVTMLAARKTAKLNCAAPEAMVTIL